MKAGEVKFQELLNGKIQYRVPLFQRTYSWQEENWQRLWDDILEIYALAAPRSHFIGAIVTQPLEDSPEYSTKFMLIDGQQRLTTLFLVLAAVRDRAKSHGQPALAEEIDDDCLFNKQVVIGDAVTYDVHWYPSMGQLFGSDASEFPLPTPDSPPPAPFCPPVAIIPVDPATPLSPPPNLDDITPQSPPRSSPDPWPQSPPSATGVNALQEVPLSPPPASPPPADLPLSPPSLSPPANPPPGQQVCVPATGAGLAPPDTGSAGLKHSAPTAHAKTDD